MSPVPDQAFVFRMWWHAADSPEWVPGPPLLARLDDGRGVPPEQLSWRTEDGAQTSVGFSPDLSRCYGHRRSAAGDVLEVRGEADSPREAGGSTGYEFSTEVEESGEWRPAERLRLLIDDGSGAPPQWVSWRDRTGETCSVQLRSAGPSGAADVNDLVTAVWASAEYPEAGEVATNLVGPAGKWFAPHDRAALEFQLTRPVPVDRYVLTSANDAPDRDPAEWTLSGSADGLLWQALDVRGGQSFADRHQPRTYRLAEPGFAEHFRLDITGNNGSPHLQLASVRFLAACGGFVGYRQRAGGPPAGYRGVRTAYRPSDVPAVPLPDGVPTRRARRLAEDHPLPAGTEVVSPSGKYALRYDAFGVPVVLDRTSRLVVWRAGDDDQGPASGALVLSHSLQVALRGGGVWYSSIGAEGARFLVVTDDGELELLDHDGVSLYNSERGFVGPLPTFEDSAPAAGITLKRYLYRKDAKGAMTRTVRRGVDGSFRVTRQNMSHHLPAPLVRWLEQDDTIVTWRQVPTVTGSDLELCLVDRAGTLLWREGSAIASTTPPPAAPHEHGGPALGRGSRLRRQSLTSPSGSHTLLHRDDGNLVLYCNAGHAPVWATGTEWLGDSWVDLTPSGDLVLRTSCGAPVWRSGTADQGVERLEVRDDGGLALLDATGAAVWRIQDHVPCAAAVPAPPRGAVLRRGQSLRNQSLTSADGGTVLNHEPGRGVRLFRADGIQLWYASGSRAADTGLTLDDAGFLLLRAEDGSVRTRLAGPGDHLAVVPGGEIRLLAPDGTVLWREGQYVIDGPDAGAAISPRAASPAALETLINAPSIPIVRTDFADDHAWRATWSDITTPREYHDDEFVLDATLVALPEFDGWTGEELAELLSRTAKHTLVFVVDAITLASPEHPVLVVKIDEDRDQPRSLRAVPHALLDLEIQLSIANMDWEDFSGAVEPDGVLRSSTAD
ncbi:DUF6924 domain-containing protein [Amycolatopsis sp. NPDC058986]|uniref:DUF6924 domain-containing protein n=1 Tax=unclassified Amycolatopsis TaxID=2618356 RepID=UPI00366D7D89